jgi:hypothetical protein
LHLQRAGAEVSQRFRPSEHRAQSLLFLAHTLAVNDVLIAAELPERLSPRATLVAVRHERDLKRRPVHTAHLDAALAVRENSVRGSR